MTVNWFACSLVVALISGTLTAAAQEHLPTRFDRRLRASSSMLSSTPSLASRLPNLAQQDFTILDNKTPSPIKSFKVMSPAESRSR